MPEPFFSVVIPAHNAEKYIEEALQSVRSQTFSDHEIIVVDDGSTDRTVEILSGCEDVYLHLQENRGAAAARNTGIRAARGKYVAFLDADDVWLSSKLEKQAAYLLANPQAAWIYTDALVFDGATRDPICRIGERIRLHEGNVLRPLLLRSFIPLATVAVSRWALFEAGLFDESRERRVVEDWCLWLQIAERHPVGLIDEPLALIRAHAENSSRRANPFTMYRRKRAILEHAMDRNPDAAEGVRLRALANIVVAAGLRCLSNAVRPRRHGGAS